MQLQELLQTNDYVGLTDAEAAELLHRERHPFDVDVLHTYRSLAGAIGIEATRRLIDTINAAAVGDSLVSEMRNYLRGENGLNVNDVSVHVMLTSFAMSDELPLTEDDASLIRGLASVSESDADRHGLGNVQAKQIHWARNGIR